MLTPSRNLGFSKRICSAGGCSNVLHCPEAQWSQGIWVVQGALQAASPPGAAHRDLEMVSIELCPHPIVGVDWGPESTH